MTAIPRHRDHSTADMLTKIVPVDWHMDAPRPRWNAFIERIFPSLKLRDYVHRAAGYSILGTNREQCFFLCHGNGRNGKSVFLNTLIGVLGDDYAATVRAESFMASPANGIRNDLASLRGIRLAVAIESGDSARLDEGLIKSVTGGERIHCRFLYHEHFTYLPAFTLWIASNHRPRIRGMDDGIWRRVRLIPFFVTIPESEVDRRLPEKLLEEREGIFDWMVSGAVEYMKRGLDAPPEVSEATSDYRQDQDPFAPFVGERCELVPNAMTAKGDVFKAYSAWAETTGEYRQTQRKLSDYIQALGVDSGKDRNGHFWIGLRLRGNAS